MLDVHIATLKDANSSWLKQCLESVRVAVDQAGFQVNVHVFDGVVVHIGKTRAIGYAKGAQPFATFVDNDDYVLPNAFSCLAPAMAKDPAAIYTRELILQNGHLRLGMDRHHLAVYRRDVLAAIPYCDWPAVPDLVAKRIVSSHTDGVVDVDEATYIYRLYVSPGRLLRRAGMKELVQAGHV